MSKNIHYRPEIDGLRALAVLPVMLFHAGVEFISGGYVGVDVFFVISGYLITSILYREIAQDKFTFSNFYERRARRILPSIYFVTFVTILPAWYVLIPSDFYDFAENIIGVVTFSSNIILWQQSDYFSQAAELKPLLHTWSLAVEEQYYVVFPLILIVLYRFIRRYLIHCLAFILILSLLLSQWAAFNKPTANYYLLPMRAWELLIGSIVALLQYSEVWCRIHKRLAGYAGKLSMLGLVLIVIPMFLYDENTRFPSFWALVPTLGAALFILFAKPSTTAYTLLSHKYLIAIGLISYSAYLWHQPVYSLIRQQSFMTVSAYTMAIAFVVSLVFAYFTWRWVEQPFRNKSRFNAFSIWLLSIIGGLSLMFFAVIVIKNEGFQARFALQKPLTIENYDLPKRSNGWCFYSVDTNASLGLGENGFQCLLGDRAIKPRILLFGDSYAGMYEPFWDVVAKQLGLSINAITTNWCYPSFTNNFWWKKETRALDQCLMNRDYVERSLGQYDTIILSATWKILANEGALVEVENLVDTLTNEKSKRVIIMAQPASLEKQSVTRAVYNGGHLILHGNDVQVKAVNKQLSDWALKNKNVFFIDRASMFEPPNTDQDRLLTVDGLPYSWDGGHISIYGSERAGANYIISPNFLELSKFIEN